MTAVPQLPVALPLRRSGPRGRGQNGRAASRGARAGQDKIRSLLRGTGRSLRAERAAFEHHAPPRRERFAAGGRLFLCCTRDDVEENSGRQRTRHLGAKLPGEPLAEHWRRDQRTCGHRANLLRDDQRRGNQHPPPSWIVAHLRLHLGPQLHRPRRPARFHRCQSGRRREWEKSV